MDFETEVRSLTFTAKFHDDCGLPPIEGRVVSVTALDITFMRAHVFGAMSVPETIDSCDMSVSDETAAFLTQWLKIGGRDPKARMSLTTHSGSFWEIMCESLSVALQEAAEVG